MRICSSCGNESPDGFKFCGHCGAPLDDQPGTAEERKIVSVLFCDLVGFTATSEQQDPEDVRARLAPYHARLRQEIERYGATVEKFVGDAVMAVFGAPVAHEDDPERAVRAGLGMLEAIAELNEDQPGLDLNVRVGINTGEAVVALGARPEHGEGFVTGDVVNTASRIQGAAPVNGVAVGEQTYRATSHVFEYQELAPVTLKGKAEPVPLWQASGIRDRFGRDRARHYRTPFVGRELERPLLIGTFERAVQQRTVQLSTIVGEPGVGKSRLIAELFSYIDAKPELVRWRQGRCLPYGEGITFWALGEIVKSEAGILESDSAEVAGAKLDAAIPPEESERQWLLQRLAPLVGIESASPAGRDELFAAWRRYLENLAAAGPRVLVFEDLHWADEALLAFLEYLVEWSQEIPLLVICAARPELYERRPGWGAGLRNAHTINLSPLSDQETAELVSHLVSTTALGAALQRAIVERSGGNPLYAEEFVRLIADRGVEPDGALLPDSVQALIAARLDTLSPDRKSMLQDAAVLGKVFWAGALVEVGDRDPAEVELALHELALKELVRPARTSSMEGESEHSFWHLLVRDVAYTQIPRADRARRHRAAAAWIEQKAGERVEDLADVLAYHYLQAIDLAEATGDAGQANELAAPARRFLALAGERALGLDTTQAENRLAQALELTPSDDAQRPTLLVRWAEAAFQAGKLRDATEALEEALPLLREERPEVAARALQLRSRIALRLGEDQMVDLALQATELLEREPVSEALVAAYGQLANGQAIAGALDEAIAAAERASTLAEQLGLPEPARALGYRGFARALLGDEDGLAEMEHALSLLIEEGAGRDAAIMQNNLGVVSYPLQGPEQSLRTFEAAVVFGEQRGLGEAAAICAANCPGLLTELGRPREALERVDRLAPLAEVSGDTHSLSELRAVALATRVASGETGLSSEAEWLLEAARASGASDIIVVTLSAAAAALVSESPEQAIAVLEEIDRRASPRGTTYFSRHMAGMVRVALAAGQPQLALRLTDELVPRYPLEEHALRSGRAQLAEHTGEHGEAARLYAEASAGWRSFGNVPEEAYALLGQGRCLHALAQRGAEEPLRRARGLFASMGYKPASAEAEKLLESAAVAPTS